MERSCPECEMPMEKLGLDGGAVWKCVACEHEEPVDDEDQG